MDILAPLIAQANGPRAENWPPVNDDIIAILDLLLSTEKAYTCLDLIKSIPTLNSARKAFYHLSLIPSALAIHLPQYRLIRTPARHLRPKGGNYPYLYSLERIPNPKKEVEKPNQAISKLSPLAINTLQDMANYCLKEGACMGQDEGFVESSNRFGYPMRLRKKKFRKEIETFCGYED